MKQSSSEARRRAAAVLEVLAGVRTPAQAAAALGVSLPRYYQLEVRAIEGLVTACEPAGRGPQPSAEKKVACLERELARLRRESDRHQALARAAQRTLGLAPPAAPRPSSHPAAPAGQSRRARRALRRPSVRALRLAKALGAGTPTAGTPSLGDQSGVSAAVDVQQSAPVSS